MTWMLTAGARQFDLQFIAQHAISIDDIGHHLAQINRFTGAACRPYSVAEHSLLVSQILEQERKVRSPSVLLAALLHDGHEAYTNDLSTPMKQTVGAAWYREEHRIQQAVLKRFGLQVAYAVNHELIGWADRTALACERRDLLPQDGPPWEALIGITPLDSVSLLGRDHFTWTDWRAAFLDRFEELQFLRGLQVQDLGRRDIPANDALSDGSASSGEAAA